MAAGGIVELAACVLPRVAPVLGGAGSCWQLHPCGLVTVFPPGPWGNLRFRAHVAPAPELVIPAGLREVSGAPLGGALLLPPELPSGCQGLICSAADRFVEQLLGAAVLKALLLWLWKVTPLLHGTDTCQCGMKV